MKNKILIIVLSVFIAFLGCKKESSETSVNILLSKTWKRGLVDKNPSTTPTDHDVQFFPVYDCDKDDTYQFDSEGNLFLNRGNDKCDENELQTETLSYSLNRTTKEFIIDSTVYTLAEESEDQIKYYIMVPGGTNLHVYIIFLLQEFSEPLNVSQDHQEK